MFATVVAAPLAGDADDALGMATYAAYSSLLAALQATEYPHLIRRNSIPGINVDDQGLERYRRFNLQRFKAYEESSQPTSVGAPACALGSFADSGVVLPGPRRRRYRSKIHGKPARTDTPSNTVHARRVLARCPVARLCR